MPVITILPIVALLAIGLLTLIIFAIIRKKWALLVIPLGLAALAFLALFISRVTKVSAPAQQIIQIGHSRAYDNASAKPLPAVWSPGMEKEFQADVYYSKASALRGIAVRLDKMVREKALNGEVMPQKISLVTYKDQFTNGLLDEAVGIFQDMLPETECSIVSAGTESFTYEDIWVSFELAESSGLPQNNGTIKAAIHVKNTSTTASVTFTEKPWLENFSVFKNSTPEKQFAIAYSQGSPRSHSQASKDAMNQARQIVKQTILSIMPQPNQGISLSQNDLYNHGIIVDSFTQSFRGSADRIHRHALLLDISPDRIMPLAQIKINGYKMHRQSWAYHILSALGIAVVICVIYLILNAATRGYYTAVLRILTIIGIIATIILILNFA